MLNLFQHLVCFFLLSADAPFIPVHRTGFSGVILIKRPTFVRWAFLLSLDLTVGFFYPLISLGIIMWW
jgi:hypothetical protein